MGRSTSLDLFRFHVRGRNILCANTYPHYLSLIHISTLYELHIGINPGIAVFIMQNVTAENCFGVIGFKDNSQTQKNKLGETGKRRNRRANFKINLFNINIGITLCL